MLTPGDEASQQWALGWIYSTRQLFSPIAWVSYLHNTDVIIVFCHIGHYYSSQGSQLGNIVDEFSTEVYITLSRIIKASQQRGSETNSFKR